MSKRKASKKERRRKVHDAQKRERRLRWLRLGGLLVLVLGGLAAFGFYRASSAPKVDAPTELMQANIDGPVDAPVRIVEFGDFGCPSCRAWHNSGIKNVLKSEFGDDISFTFRHFPVITRLSPKAAEASQCAAEQDRFWEFHDFIYERTPIEALAINQLKDYGIALGLDSGQYNQCLDSGKYGDYVARDQQAALIAGAAGTPTFFINGNVVSFSYEGMSGTIRQILGR
jgi:protein-disulfide isomerase